MDKDSSSEDSVLSCDDLPKVFMPRKPVKDQKRSQSKLINLTGTDADALFDDIRQQLNTKYSKIPKTDSGCSQTSDQDSDVEEVTAAPVHHVDSGISMRYATSTDSENCGASRPGTSGKKGAAASKPTKTSKGSEREAKKQKLAEERAAKQAASELNKVYKPGECMKYMNIEAHPSLLSAWYLADLQREVSSSSARLSPAPDVVHEGLMLWSRRKPRIFTSDDGQARLTDPTERCTQALLIHTAEEVAPHVLNHTLTEHVAGVRTLADCALTLVVFGVKDYYSSTRLNKVTDKRKFNDLELEMSFTDLLVSANCDALVINKPIDLALLIVQYTKALAEAPHKLAKRACDEQADFYMRGDNKNCVSVDKDGHGLGRLWQQMLAVLPLSSLEVSRAVAARHRSPLDLYEALQEPGGVAALANTGVARAAAPGARARKLGPEFARKLAMLLTAEDGETLLE